MREPPNSLPLRYRSINFIGAALRRVHPVASLDEQALCEAATRATGLSDFGEPHFREGLRVLLSSAEHDARLHFIGRLALRQMIVTNLANRLRLVEARRSAPELFGRRLIPPIIVLGLPRSGTTLLHRLLAADPTHRALEFWELLRPVPLRGAFVGDRDQRRGEIEKLFERRLAMVPDLDRKHYIRPDSPEECMWLQSSSFVSMSFWAIAPVYGYLEWYSRQDRSHAYAEYRQWLHLFQYADQRRRLTLKAPSHTGSLGALHRTLPDALLIQTHRDPVTICNSFNSLFATLQRIATHRPDLRRMAQANLQLLESELAQNLAAREQYPGAVYDVQYEQLVGDPVGTVRQIYSHYGLAWSDGYEAQLKAYMRANPRAKYGQHSYAASDFGQTPEQLAARFGAYSEQLGLIGTA